jgi:ribosomal protein L37AE/L43A
LHQNYKHLKTLQNLLKLPESKFFSIVIFSETACLKTNFPPNVVLGGKAYLNFIRQHQTIILSDAMVHESTIMLLENRLTAAEHQTNVDKKQEQYRKAALGEKPDCPRCGRAMVRRIAQKGSSRGKEFWGCSAYPKCKTVINIQAEQEQVVNAMKIFLGLWT